MGTIIAALLIGVVIGVAALFIVALTTARKDEEQFTAKNGPMFDPHTQTIYSTGEEWKSSLKVTIVSTEEDKPKRKKNKKDEKSLQQQLETALAEERYEEAARLRDEINKKKK